MAWLRSKIKGLLPGSDNYLGGGLRLLLLNLFILFGVGGISLGTFWLVYRVRLLGFPLPLPVWIVLLGTGIPVFMIWFQYGKVFGSFTNKGRITKGLVLGILGNIPGFIALYILVNNDYVLINPEIHRIILIMLLMNLVVMPIMIVLGILDQK